MRLLYVHGYNGNPYGDSYQTLRTACSDRYELFTIDYDSEFPSQAISNIFAFIKENKIDVVIGASLGGFLTMNLYGVSRIVVNPCWNPAEELTKLGYNGNIKSYELLLDRMLDSLDFEEKNLCSGVFSADDELLGRKYVDVFKKYFAAQYDIVGEHRISEKMAQEIINNILPLHVRDVTDFTVKLKAMDNAPWL